MKWILILAFATLSLQAGWFGSDERREEAQKVDLAQQFRENASDANAIVKRGEYDLISQQEEGLARIRSEVMTLRISEADRKALSADLETYEQTVRNIGSKLQKRAPKLNEHYRYIISGLPTFNKHLGSIGLGDLLHGWRELSRTKDRFVKEPAAKQVKSFDREWTNINVIITELYLDDDMEKPLLDYLAAYKSYFNELESAYQGVGYAEVQKLKPLVYKIKLQFQMLTPELTVAER